MKASDSVVDINITSVLAVNISLQGMDYYNPVTIAALPSGVDLTGSIVRDSAGNEFSCYFHTSASNTMGLATPKGAGLVLATGAATASARRLQGDFSGKETFQRFSTGTYIDSLTGLVKTAMPNEMRFERMADGGVGVLLEGTSTNITLHSNSFSSVASNQVCVPAPTNNNAISPDGASTAWTYANTSSGVNQKNYAIAADTSTWTISRFFMKGGTGQIYFTSQGINQVDTLNEVIVDIASLAVTGTGAAAAISNNNLTVTEYDTYFRVSSTHTNDGTATILICYEFLTGAYTGLTSWGTQVENLPLATSYIPTTTAAVTRAADSLTIPMAGNLGDRVNACTVSMEFDINGDTALPQQLMASSGTFRFFGLSANSSRIAGAFSGYTNTQLNKVQKYTTSTDGSLLKVFVDGKIQTSQAAGLTPIVDSNTSVWFGTNVDGITHSLYGHIRNLRIYDQALTDQEIGAL
ncbi:MAG: LamG-like jellyroll fold domain-containing protein, partial [Ghiorsea sp.]